MNKKASNFIKYTFSFLLAIALVYFAFKGVDWKEFLDGLKSVRWFYIFLFFVVSVIALIFREERWKAMMEPLDKNVRRDDCWDASNVGNLVNVALPGAGEFVRCGYLVNKKMSYDKVLGTVVCERAWDVVAVVFLFIASMLFEWDRMLPFLREHIVSPIAENFSFSIWWILVPIVLVAGIWAFFHYGKRTKLYLKIREALVGIWLGIKSFTQMEHKWAFLLYTLGIWFMYLLMSYFTFLAIPSLEHLTLMDALFISSIGNIASVVPVPGGVGAYHYLVAMSLMTIYGSSWEAGLLCATLSHGLHAVLLILLGVLSYFVIGIRRKRLLQKEV